MWCWKWTPMEDRLFVRGPLMLHEYLRSLQEIKHKGSICKFPVVISPPDGASFNFKSGAVQNNDRSLRGK